MKEKPGNRASILITFGWVPGTKIDKCDELNNPGERELTLSGTERLAVRNIASAIPWAYQGYEENKTHITKTEGNRNTYRKFRQILQNDCLIIVKISSEIKLSIF